MLKIIHGENLVASRKKLTELIDEAKKKNQEVSSLEAEKLDRAKLEAALLSESLFGNEKLLIIESLYSLPKSKKKDEFIDLISSASIELILWEKKLLTKTNLKKFGNDFENYEFKVSSKLWTFLDQLSANKNNKKALLKIFRESIESDDAEFVFLMLARQIRLLIQIKENHPPKIAPFMMGKLNSQARTFSLEKLLELHQQLYQIDQKQKQSTGLLSLASELDLFLFNM
ncbi:MAG: hypothetical protein UT13_C0001G0594 [Candidatus Pacebacteria bacterium GW2011_GWF2_38_9]|nr:MAG: hypothetical protein US01_C0001G0611 [candidate division TM6 bacterium GW2011_GWF2_28_16]KKQ08226.1 MAG: hypothetical protein US20_C0022G0014 [Candidatus Pacebacteria bacterium GW2011_GWF1_36_5]KKQ88947.1 MAG: hypothetical protein UT13_C0001G0594 [Candidatus Pacebacteria bacterium GW2011_GWF2_38_9]HAZ73122.1 hypothetical protein [Candidatus Paceibacterota bacterium]